MMAITETGSRETMTFAEYLARVEYLDGGPIRYADRDQVEEAYQDGITVNDLLVRLHYQWACRRADRNV